MRPKFRQGEFDEPHPHRRRGYRTEWGQVVGNRVRVLRTKAGLHIYELARDLYRGDGRPYSTSFVSRLERGWASAPLHTYVVIANRFEVEPGELLGNEDIASPVSAAELTLVRALREIGVSPEEAIARVARRD